MAASDHLSPDQFGVPKGYRIEKDPLTYRTVNAYSPRGAHVGALRWDKGGGAANGSEGEHPAIQRVDVVPRHQRRGLASAMLNVALQHEPNLHHSHALTDAGKAFADRNPLPPRREN